MLDNYSQMLTLRKRTFSRIVSDIYRLTDTKMLVVPFDFLTPEHYTTFVSHGEMIQQKIIVHICKRLNMETTEFDDTTR